MCKISMLNNREKNTDEPKRAGARWCTRKQRHKKKAADTVDVLLPG
jgi:hypothetical protein